jgi:hypothetical protein
MCVITVVTGEGTRHAVAFKLHKSPGLQSDCLLLHETAAGERCLTGCCLQGPHLAHIWGGCSNQGRAIAKSKRARNCQLQHLDVVTTISAVTYTRAVTPQTNTHRYDAVLQHMCDHLLHVLALHTHLGCCCQGWRLVRSR